MAGCHFMPNNSDIAVSSRGDLGGESSNVIANISRKIDDSVKIHSVVCASAKVHVVCLGSYRYVTLPNHVHIVSRRCNRSVASVSIDQAVELHNWPEATSVVIAGPEQHILVARRVFLSN